MIPAGPPREVTPPYWWPLPPLAGTPAPLEALVAGTLVETERGPFFRRRLVLDAGDHYGGCRLGDFLQLNAQSAAALARQPDLADVPLEHTLFLDTETTGLAGGTGTYAFLVGLGRFHRGQGGDTFILDQCFMRTYGEERAMLAWVAAEIERSVALVTFNGRTFDVPLLQTRFVMSRMRLDLEEWLHFDLLPAARRLWRPMVGSCSLQSLERHVLQAGREDDVESFLIPAIYHQYLRDGDGRYLQRVFNHNRADILSMVALAVRACALLDCHGGSGGPSRSELTAAEFVGLSRVYEQMGNLDAAARAYLAALDGALPADLRHRSLMGLAALYKRRGQYDSAAALWQAVVDELPSRSVMALVELAKYWEHRRRDPARAYELAQRAHDRWRAGLPATERPLPGLGSWRTAATPATPDDFGRRLARLERKRRPEPESGGEGCNSGLSDAAGEAPDNTITAPPQPPGSSDDRRGTGWSRSGG